MSMYLIGMCFFNMKKGVDILAYPTILNKEGTTLAYLNNCTECFIDEEINGAYTLSFVCTVDDLKTQFLYDEDNIIEVNDDLFRALIIEELHTENSELTVSVECEHISYDLLKTTFDTFSYPYATAALVMTQCLQATGFAFTGTDVTLKTDINYQEESNAKQISIAIANNWKGELQYHRHNIHLWNKRGANRGVDFRFGKNIKGIKKTLDRSKRDSEGNPTVSYEIDVVELKHLEEYNDLEYFELGDTVRIVDDMLSVNIQARIVKRTYNVLTETNESITLGNILDDIRGSLSGIKDDINNVQANVDNVKDTITGNKPNWDKINKITNDLGNVIASKLEGEMDLAQAQITNSTGTFFQQDNMSYWQNQPTKEASTFASRWNAVGISFANSKLPNGDWIWQSAMNAEGLIATKVLASAMATLSLEAVNILATKFTGQEINGLVINGGSANFGKDSEQYVFEKNGRFKMLRLGDEIARLATYTYNDKSSGSFEAIDVNNSDSRTHYMANLIYNQNETFKIRSNRGVEIFADTNIVGDLTVRGSSVSRMSKTLDSLVIDSLEG